MEALRAAVANGADAVYFGLRRHSARQRAVNFAVEELPDVMRYLHRHNVRGYVTFNTLIFSDELAEAARFAAAIAQAGADAAIVQDLGVARLVHRLAPTLPLHASTQMTLTEPRGIELARQLGIERVILARELSLAQIRHLRQATDMPLEVFVHGALCISYSGQCLASEALWGRSANRGLCGQACRLPYALVVNGRRRHLGDKAYLLSPKDLAACDRIDDLVRLGVAGLKIEGRLKSAAYVAVATQVYRAAIDAALAGHPFHLPPQQRRDLTQSYSRGFTNGFLDGPDHLDLVDGRFPASRGVRVGTVADKTARGILVETGGESGHEELLKPGDGIVFGDAGRNAVPQGGRVYSVEPAAGPRGPLLLGFGSADVDLAEVAIGSTVWKTDDPRFRRDMARTYARDTVYRREPLSVRLMASVGQPLRVIASDAAGHQVEVAWDQPLEAARKRPLTPEVVREQFGRLGDTPFELAAVELSAADGRAPAQAVMVPKSVLNDLRRRAVAGLLAIRDEAARHAVTEPGALAAIRKAMAGRHEPEGGPDDSAPRLHVLVRRPEQLAPLLRAPVHAGTVYLDFQDPRRYGPAVAKLRQAAVPVGIATLRIAKPDEEDAFELIAACEPDAVLIRNLAGLAFFRARFPHLPLVGDFPLNVANEISAAVLKELGLVRMATSLDLNLRQLTAMLEQAPPEWFEVPVHLHVPLMHTEHCLFAANLGKAHDARDCGRPCERGNVALRDRIGAEHPLAADARCRNTLFSARVQSALALLGEMQRLGLRHFRLELLQETPQQVTAVLELYRRALAADLDLETAWRQLETLFPAGVTRGTWDLE